MSDSITIPSYIRGENPKLLHQGAEAKIYLTIHKNQSCFVKERFSKQYRIPDLDLRLRKKQFKSELKALELCAKNNIPVPTVLDSDPLNTVIYLNQLPGIPVRQYIESIGDLLQESNQTAVDQLAQLIGQSIAKLHSISVIHGDLTTSNMIINVNSNSEDNNSQPSFYLIDFGLSQISDNVEEKAVDLYVLERAIETTHSNSKELIHKTLLAYKTHLDQLSTKSVPTLTVNASTETATGQEQPTPQPNNPPSETSPPPVELDAKALRAQRKQQAKNKKEIPQGTQVMERLLEVRARGRKKSMIG